MSRYSTIFERELKGILQGNEDIINSAIKSATPSERQGYMKIFQKPFMVVRAAGSLGVDLIAIRGDISFPIEVKTSSQKTVHFSKSEHLQKQLDSMLDMCSKVGIIPVYAYRLRSREAGDKWRIFAMPSQNLSGRIGIMYERIPKPEKTHEGNIVLRWDSGMPLSKFIEYLCL